MAVASVVALTALGLAVRALDLGAVGVWFDESYHVALVREPTVAGMLDAILANPPSAPLYSLLLRGWVGVAGSTDAAIRVPSVLAGTLTVPAAAWLAAELDGRRAVVLVTAMLVAVSPYALEFSQEAAPYALAALLTTLALAAGLRWLRTGDRGMGVVAVATAVVAVYAHYAAGVVLGLGWLLWWPREDSRVQQRAWLVGGIAVLAAWSPWLLASAAAWVEATAPRASLSSAATFADVARAVGRYVAGSGVMREGMLAVAATGVATLGVLVALGWWAGRDPVRGGLRRMVVVAALVLLVPAAVSAVTGWWVFIPHFGLLSLPGVAAVAAAGAAELGGAAGGPARPRPAATALATALGAALVVAAVAVELAGVAVFRAAPPHGDDGLRELVARLEGEASTADPILVSPAILLPSLRQYTSRTLVGIPEDFDLRDIYGPYAHPQPEASVRDAVTSAAAGSARLWLVTFEEIREHEIIVAELSRTYQLGLTYQTEFATLLRFDRSSARTP